MNDDDKFADWLREAAVDYNTPGGEVPREAMWQAIAPRLPQAGDRGASVGGRVPRWIPWLAAATLLVAVSYQVGVRQGERGAEPVVASRPAAPAAGAVYDEATRAHFERADALLTSVRAASPDALLDPALHRWARDMLADTRLLLDSPAAAAADRRRLFEDLELALAQIVQLSAAGTPDDRRLVERSLRRGEVLTRLRNAAPAPVSGT